MSLEEGCHAVVRVREELVFVASLEKTGLELPTLFGCDLLGATETSNADGDKGFGDCFGGDVKERDCLRPTYISIDGFETVPEARRNRQLSDQVDRHVGETCRREVETPEWDLHVPRDLRSLAECTGACLCAAVFLHTRPHEPLRHQFEGIVGPGVDKALKGFKILASERRG